MSTIEKAAARIAARRRNNKGDGAQSAAAETAADTEPTPQQQTNEPTISRVTQKAVSARLSRQADSRSDVTQVSDSHSVSEAGPATTTPEPVASTEARVAATPDLDLPSQIDADALPESSISKALETGGKVSLKPRDDASPGPSVSVTPPPAAAVPSSGGIQGAPEYATWCEIDTEALTREGFLGGKGADGRLVDEFRRIKRQLLLNVDKAREQGSSERPPNLVMVTSALPAEGKTYVSINLAMSIAAERDSTVLLVDGDVAKGDVAKYLGIERARGLTDLLRENIYVAEDAVLDTNIPSLQVLSAGQYTEDLNELFASELMLHIASGLAAHNPDRIVLFDAPPLLVTTEASVLARHMGQIVVVVEAGRTPQSALVSALRELEDCPNVGTVLNKFDRRFGMGYGYGYGYGYGQQDRDTQETAAVG